MRRLGIALLMLLLVACTGQPSADEIVRRAQAAMEGLERAHAVVEVAATVDGETVSLVGEGWMDGERGRATILEASEPALVGSTAVSDGAQGWLYHPELSKVLTGEREALAAYAAEHGESPADIELSSLTEMVDELLRVTDQSLVGTGSIAGYEAWHLRLTPNAEAPPELAVAGLVAELWIAQSTDLPLQLIVRGGEFGEGRVTVRSLELDPAFAADLFTFTPPADAEVIDVATLLPVPMTLVEARAEAPFPLLSTPEDSAEAALAEVARVGESYVQRFEGTLGPWTLVQGTHEAGHESMARGEAVTVRGVEGWLASDAEGGRTTLAWEEAGHLVALSGAISPETALRLAEALD